MKKIYGIATLAALLMGATLLLARTVKVAAAAPSAVSRTWCSFTAPSLMAPAGSRRQDPGEGWL
jgi:hypothetical protein